MIKAPYNFVPLSEYIFFPDWAENISHDIPFENGVSGTIEVTIKSETPIFVRNGHILETEDNSFSHIYSNEKKHYFIPGSTVKGCIRNIIEIMSFGKMHSITDSHTKKNYNHSPKQLELERQALSVENQSKKADSFDLTECIFGSLYGKKTLCGRVQFTSFVCTKEVSMPEQKKSFRLVLNTPDPSVLPIYVSQDGGEYIDYDADFIPSDILKGWKRYVLRTGYWTKANGKNNVVSTFMPLNRGTVFKGKIHYHNLRKQELGAILCALTWHGETNCYHQLGQAKPFGFGRVSINVDNFSDQMIKEYISSFEEMMKGWLTVVEGKPGWRKHWIIDELFVLSKTIIDANDNIFKYMDNKEFKLAKKNKEYLLSLKEIINE